MAQLELLLDQNDGLTVDSIDDNGNTLMHVACQNGSKRFAKALLRRGASINTQNKVGNTPLHFAFSFQYGDLGRYLVDKGADDSIVNALGQTCYEGISPVNL
jgi:ankyrin repeat protein